MSSDLNTTIKTLSGHTSYVFGLKILPDSRLASCSGDMTVRIWNLTKCTQDMTLYGHTSTVRSLDVLSNGYLVSVGDDSTIRVWNTTTGNLIMNITNAHSSSIYVVKTINQYNFATGSLDGTVKVLEINC